MSVSKAVRMALKKAGKQNGDLAELWGYQLNAVSNKFQMERWTGKELSEVADLTGGQLAFVYPDGTQAWEPYETTLLDGEEYDVESPGISGYRPVWMRITGKNPGMDEEYIVLYLPDGQDSFRRIDDYDTPLGVDGTTIQCGICAE